MFTRYQNEVCWKIPCLTGITRDVELTHSNGGDQPHQQHRDHGHGHHLDQDDCGDNRAVPKTFIDLHPHTPDPPHQLGHH